MKKKDKNQLKLFDYDTTSKLSKSKAYIKLKNAKVSSSKNLETLFFDNRINLIDVKTLGKICGVTPKTIHNWVYLKQIPYLKIGRRVMFKKRSLITWFNRKEIKPWV